MIQIRVRAIHNDGNRNQKVYSDVTEQQAQERYRKEHPRAIAVMAEVVPAGEDQTSFKGCTF